MHQRQLPHAEEVASDEATGQIKELQRSMPYEL